MALFYNDSRKMVQGILSVSCFMLVLIGNIIEGCPEGFQSTTDQGPCYKVFTEKKNWAGARESCRQELADLVKVDDADSVSAMQKLASHVYPHYWIGLTDFIIEGEYCWLDGTKLANPNWDLLQRQPNGRTRQNCVVGESVNAVWEDKDCQDEYAYVCQFQNGIKTESLDSHVSTIITEKRLQEQQHLIDRKSALGPEDCARYCIQRRSCDIFTYIDIPSGDCYDNCLLGFYGPVTSLMISGPGVNIYKCPIE